MTASIFREGLFADRVAIVTGGATGIGLAIAEELVQLGASVVIASRKRERLEIAARGLAEDHGATVVPVVCNIREREQVEGLFDATLGRFGRLDFLVNNGGGQFLSPATAITDKGFRAVVDTNLTGTFQMCQVAHAKWMGQHGGRIVNIVADMWRGFPGMAHTGAARAGVVNLTQTLAIEWAADGVLVNAVAPGIILSTGMNNYPEGVVEAAARLVPLKRLGTTREVAWSVLHLLSPAGDFITGASMRVDGGASLWNSGWQIPDKPGAAVEIPPWPEDRWPEHAEAVRAMLADE